jgi:sugar/nucleoside kinase (ribokinase family)
MTKIVVVGTASLAFSGAVEGFPVTYIPVRYPAWAHVGVGGVGAHIAHVLADLGTSIRLCTVVGQDVAGTAIRAELAARGLGGPSVVTGTGSSLVMSLAAPDGRRIGMSYLDDVDRFTYPPEQFVSAAHDADLAVMTNTVFARNLLPYAVALGIPVAVDVHLISDLEDDYDRPWLDVADVLFCSDEQLPCSPEEWAARVLHRYQGCAIIGIGCGRRGAVMGLRDGRLLRVNAVAPRGVVNTLGAGDSLLASFLHGWLATGNAVEALRDAVLYAGWQVGFPWYADNRLDAAGLAELRTTYRLAVEVTRWRHGTSSGSARNTA